METVVKTDLVESTRKCEFSKYSFAGLKLSFSQGTASYAASNISGTVCGDPLKTAWSVTYSYTGTGSVKTSAKFATANPYAIRKQSFADGSTIAIRLRFTSDVSPKMTVEAVPSGKVGNVKVSPAETAVKVVKVEAC
jgi:hypothetical protein